MTRQSYIVFQKGQSILYIFRRREPVLDVTLDHTLKVKCENEIAAPRIELSKAQNISDSEM